MSCCAINEDGRDCRNYSMRESLYCHIHTNLSIDEMTARWKKRHITDVKYPMLLHSSNLKYLEWTLLPIKYGLLKISRKDMETMRHSDSLVDIYIILCLIYDYPITINRNMWHRCHIVLMMIIDNALIHHYLLPILLERLVISSEETFISFFNRILNHSNGAVYSRPPFQKFFMAILISQTLKDISWNYLAIESLKKKVIHSNCNKSVADFLEKEWFPAVKELYLQEKRDKKARMAIYKEQLMMVCWHPDKVAAWLEEGGWPLLDMMIGC